MKVKNDIENPKLKENPFVVPDGYFQDVKMSVTQRISAGSAEKRVGFLTVLRPQLALVSAFVIVFLAGYAAFTFLTPGTKPDYVNGLSANSQFIEEGFLRTTFIDFFEDDNENQVEAIHTLSQDEVFNYLSENLDIITLASIDDE